MAGIATARTIDIHAHAVLADTMGAAGRFGPEMGMDAEGKPWFRVGDYKLLGVKYKGSPFMDVDLRVKRMDLLLLKLKLSVERRNKLIHILVGRLLKLRR